MMPRTANSANELRCTFPSLSANEALARSMAAAFCAQMNPTCDELSDIKCAVSEAVTNAIVHGYRDVIGEVTMILKILDGRVLSAEIRDKGCGIPDVEEAMRPLYTTDPENERSGMGFTIIENFMDTM
ncbi:MAG: anti-sigma F factor, partial [Clostridia bacterium]|nr:anti-sigma F factor [Clostridia bacterium]